MRIKVCLLLLLGLTITQNIGAQYLIEGKIENRNANTEYIAYLSVVNEWDGFQTIREENIIKSVEISHSGHFRFTGNELSEKKGFYQIHFAPRDNPTLLIGYPKNYIHFILTNKDSVYFTVKSRSFASLTHVSSSVSENYELKDISSRLDSLKIQIFRTSLGLKEDSLLKNQDSLYAYLSKSQISDPNLITLLEQKRKEYLLDKIRSNHNALLNMYSISFAELNYDAYSDLYNETSNLLKNSDYRENYHISLQNFINTHSFREKDRKINNLYIAVFFLAALSILLFVYVVVTKKRNNSLERNDKIDDLTSKELEVYHLILEHKSNKQIASLLFISPATVKTHVNNIYRKLGLKSRKELISKKK